MRLIPYGKQFIDKKDKLSVLESLSSDLITTGPYVKKLENKLKKYLNCKYSHVCNSGTSALHLAMLSIGLKKNDTVLMPAVNFIASYNIAKLMQLKVYLIDVDKYTGQISPNKILECIKKFKIKKINALIVMYNGGYPEYSKEIYDIKKKYNFFLIEDACHAFGSEYKYKNSYIKIGSCKHADISTFSMHPLKTITSGEGGIVTTNKAKFSKKIELFRSHGMLKDKKKHWEYDILETGFNYRLSDLNCALGLSQLKKINLFLKKRKNIYNKYVDAFKNFHPDLILPKYSNNIKPSYHLFLLNIRFEKLKKRKNYFMKYLKDKNIIAQQHYIPIYKFSVFKKTLTGLTGSENYYKNTISIPIFTNLSDKDQIKVIKTIKIYFKKQNKK